jgi:hypothetical protein
MFQGVCDNFLDVLKDVNLFLAGILRFDFSTMG